MAQTIATTAKGHIEYRLEGSGPVILVLNGGHCSRETRLSHEKLTEHGFSVLTPSRPGYDSTPSEIGKSAQAAADALAGLLDTLQIATVDVIGISAAGSTALAFVQQYPNRVRKLVLESAVTTDWDEQTKRRSRLGFGRAAKVTWAFMHLMLKLFPTVMIKALLHDLTVLDVNTVIKRMSQDDLAFIKRMIQASRSGTGFMNDIEHKVDHLATITRPVLVMYSPNDATVSPKNARRIAREIATCELYEVPSDTHLIWIGNSAKDVWQKRLSFIMP
ncbi:MAG TPA: alpha/beta hydrolase [Anaerolineales bacterium]|nr:alpha/beta hydrolase [Anaerolineales bacterium]